MDDLAPRLDQLNKELDALEAAVAPLLLRGDKLAAAAVRLPLLDQAKLHVLASYTFESTLFCGLGLSGVPAREHAVFRELLRVRQYMKKIEAAEKPADENSNKPTSRLDRAAAIRFVKADMDNPDVKAKLGELEKAAAADSSLQAAQAAAAVAARRHGPGGRGNGNGNGRSSGGLTKRPKQGQASRGSSAGRRGRGARPA